MAKRSLWVAAGGIFVGAGVVLVLAAQSTVSDPHPSSWLLPVGVAGLVVGGYLVISGLVGIAPARPDIDPDHRAELRQLADRIGKSAFGNIAAAYHTPAERNMFEAHWKKVAPKLERAHEAVAMQEPARATLVAHLQEAAHRDFPVEEFWQPRPIAHVAAKCMEGRESKVKLTPDELLISRIPFHKFGVVPVVVWRDAQVWEPKFDSSAARASDAQLQALIERIRDWFAPLCQRPVRRSGSRNQ